MSTKEPLIKPHMAARWFCGRKARRATKVVLDIRSQGAQRSSSPAKPAPEGLHKILLLALSRQSAKFDCNAAHGGFDQRFPGCRQAGISLIELILFIVIVSIGIVGILSVMNITTAHSADPMVRKQALAIAEGMLEEVLLKDFSNPSGGYTCGGTCTQTDRASLDDVSDYSGFATTGIYPIDSSTAIGGLSDYSVSVGVNAAASLGTIGGGEVKLVTVTVTGPGSESIALSGYRTNYAP